MFKKITICGLAIILAAGFILPSAEVMAASKAANKKSSTKRQKARILNHKKP